MSIIHRAEQKKNKDKQQGKPFRQKTELGLTKRVNAWTEWFRSLKNAKWFRTIKYYRRGLLALFLLALLGYFVVNDAYDYSAKIIGLWGQRSNPARSSNVAIQIKDSQLPNEPVANLDQLMEDRQTKRLKSLSLVEKNNRVTHVIFSFDQMPFYVIQKARQTLTLNLSKVRPLSSVKPKANNSQAIESIKLSRTKQGTQAKLTLSQDTDWSSIDAKDHQLTLVLSENAKPSSQTSQDKADKQRDGSIKKVKHQLSAKEKAERQIARAKSAFQSNDKQKAKRHLQKALTLDPEHLGAIQLLATIYLDAGHSRQALKYIDQGIQKSDHAPQFVILKAYALIGQNKVDEACSLLNHNEPVNMGDHLNYYALLANLQLREKRYQQAADIYQALLGYDSAAGRWWIGLGIAEEKLKRYNEAQQAYERALQDRDLPPGLRSFASAKSKNNR